MTRSYYSNSIKDFIQDDSLKILGKITSNHPHENLTISQTNAWKQQIEILKTSLSPFSWGHIFFEFAIPRMGKRADNILIIGDLIFVIEFKVGDGKHEKHAVEQVIDYTVDLKNFHEGSHQAKLFPLLVSTEAPEVKNLIRPFQDMAFQPLFSNKANLTSVLSLCLSEKGNSIIDPLKWEQSIYKPTPTIIEAAQALYKGHNVQEISRSDAGATNLAETSDCINKIIEISKHRNEKSICFITGVPGAGKTLAGLNIANQRMNADESEHAVFLSGNGPLVDVLREALTRDEVSASKVNGKPLTKKQAAIKANAFIQNIHHFRDDSLISKQAPIEKVVIFDEAQRAWTREQASAFMRRKKGVENFNMSEPQFLIDVMNRHQGSCTIICLIGGGQEINTGEAGLEEWFQALRKYFPAWKIYHSNLIANDPNYLRDQDLRDWVSINTTSLSELHLAVSVRSFRSEKLAEFVEATLDRNIGKARNLYSNFLVENYPIVVTRDLNEAKKWLRKNARGTERTGIVASSGAYRLRPYGVSVLNQIAAPIWFLNDKDDVRSSFFLEEVATEFDIQGLELDWTCICWDADFFYANERWNPRKFKGTKWQNINNEIIKRYLANAYRVLLTRARQGMVIFVPFGDKNDKTRLPEFYDGTFEYLKSIGLMILK